MSVESLVISEIVAEGSPKKAFQAGVSSSDFEIYDEEWQWIISRAEQRRAITARAFKKRFPDFEYVRSGERLVDLLEDFKQELAYAAISGGIDEVLRELEQDNAVEIAIRLREILGEAVSQHSPASDVLLKSEWQKHFEEQKQLQVIRENGDLPGIPTGLTHFDVHFGGLQQATTYVFLGRPGDAKSMTLAKLAVEAMFEGYRVGMFSPEMDERTHRCRVNTLLSAKKEVQIGCNLKGAFRNRALRDGSGYNLKAYKRYLEWVEENVTGEIALFTQKYKREKLSAAFIESRVDDLGLDVVFVDPLYKLRPPRRRQLKHEDLADIVDQLQGISMSFNIPVIMSNQAGRALVGSRGDPPTKDSSHGSDAPAQEADCVIGVKHYSEERQLKFNCSKNRHGESFRFTCAAHLNIGRILDVTPIRSDFYSGYDTAKAEELREAMKEIEEAQP